MNPIKLQYCVTIYSARQTHAFSHYKLPIRRMNVNLTVRPVFLLIFLDLFITQPRVLIGLEKVDDLVTGFGERVLHDADGCRARRRTGKRSTTPPSGEQNQHCFRPPSVRVSLSSCCASLPAAAAACNRRPTKTPSE